MSMVTGSWATRSLAAALSESVAWKRCSPMVMVTLMRSACGLSEVGVGFGELVGLVVEGAPVGGRPVSVSVSPPHPAPARPTTADSAVARSVRDMGIEGIRSPVRRMSEGEQHLRGGALVHRLVALRRLVQREGEVEDLAGVDLAVPDELDQLGQVLPDRGGAAVDVDTGHEQLVAGDRDVVGDTDEAHVTARPGGVDRLHHGLLGADGLDDRVGAEPAGEFLDPGDAVVAALGDDVGCTEFAGQRLAVGVAAEGDDPLGAELLR